MRKQTGEFKLHDIKEMVRKKLDVGLTFSYYNDGVMRDETVVAFYPFFVLCKDELGLRIGLTYQAVAMAAGCFE